MHVSTTEWVFSDGIIVSLPMELRDKHRIQKYSEISSIGWSLTEFGYSAYAFHLPMGQLVVLPGLNVVGHSQVKKKFYGYKQELTRSQVEALARSTCSLIEAEVLRTQGDLAMLVHDLRALSNAIYNPAQEAQSFLENDNSYEAKKRIETVIAAQGILKMRTDALDFSGNAVDPDDVGEVDLYRKIDKVQRCFKSMASRQKKSVVLYGSSYRKARGQDFFELVPYTLIDNAIKYSPEGYEISVDVRDSGGDTFLTVKSYGPKIDEAEKDVIFSKYVRGRAAIDTRRPGSGVGLNIAYKISVGVFHGSIEVRQGSGSIVCDGINYYETNFIVRIPSFKSSY